MSGQRSDVRRSVARRRGLLVVLAVVAVAFGVVVWLGGRSDSKITDTATTDGSTPVVRDEPAVVRRDPADAMALGDVNAPVVIVEWLDMRCPFCAQFSRETLPGIVADYVDAGLVRYEVRDVAFFGDQSTDAAVAARAAAEQGAFHEFLSAVYAAAPERGHPDLTRERLTELARQAGIADLPRFQADLDRPDLRQAVQRSTLEAGQLGVTSVPFFVIGNSALAGAQPAEVFHQAIDAAIAEARAR